MLRLTTTNVWDVPIKVKDKVVHLIINRPTSTATDDAAHRNADRNHDEIKFVADYVSGDDKVIPSRTWYITDDASMRGGLEIWSRELHLAPTANVPFVVLGQDNATAGLEPLLNQAWLHANASSDRPEVLPSHQFKVVGGSVLTPAPSTQPVAGSTGKQRFVYVDVKF